MDARINGDREACIQGDGSGKEDCLYLDIVKPDDPSKTGLPIYFWIHGGHFRNGAGGWYTGAPLGDSEEMIVVSIQYRLGPMGWLNYPRHKGTEIPLNIGLWDQRMALKFIYDYATTIGGDPNRITVSGESAGGISTSIHALSPSSMYISQTLQQSGAAALSTPEDYANAGIDGVLVYICGAISCPAFTTGQDILAYLRTLPSTGDNSADFWTAYHILTAATSAGPTSDDRDFYGGKTLDEILAEKSFKVMPTIIFFTSFEGSLSVGAYPDKYDRNNYKSVWTDEGKGSLLMAHKDLTGDEINELTWRSYAKLACDFPDETAAKLEQIDDDTGIRIALDLYGDLMFRGPGIRVANEYFLAGANTWIMHFDTTENHGDLQWSKKAPHAAELKYLFGWGPTGAPGSVSEFLLKTWRAFVTTGSPSWGPYNFPQYDGFERHIEIESENEATVIVRSDDRFDFDAHLFYDR